MAEETSVLIAGACPTGLTLAVTLACRGIKAMLIDKSERGQDSSRAICTPAPCSRSNHWARRRCCLSTACGRRSL